MNKSWQVVFALIIVFVAGGATGSVLTLRYVSKTVPVPAVRTGGTRAEQFGGVFVRRWLQANATRLKLTQAQREKIRGIAFDTVEDLARTNNEGVHSNMLILEHMQDEIASVLNPEQRNNFYQAVQQQRENFNRFTKEWHSRTMEQAQAIQAQAP